MINQCINTYKLMKILVIGIMIDNLLVIRLNPFIFIFYVYVYVYVCLYINFGLLIYSKYNFVFYKENID